MKNWPWPCGGLKLLLSDGKDAGHNVYGLHDHPGPSGTYKSTETTGDSVKLQVPWENMRKRNIKSAGCFQPAGKVQSEKILGDLSNH